MMYISVMLLSRSQAMTVSGDIADLNSGLAILWP